VKLTIIPILENAVIKGIDDVTGDLVAEGNHKIFIRIRLSSITGITYAYSTYDVETDEAIFYEGPYGDPARDVVVAKFD